MMKIVSVVGARPQFIKVKPIIDELNKKRIKHVLIHTGQHYDYHMSKTFFDELKIPKPDYNLEAGSGSHGKQTAIMLERIERVLLQEKPDIVVVYGDTNSTLAGALAAAKLNLPIAHVEAGLRSFRKDMPEEINRVLSDHLSTFLFCPTRNALKNLKKENITKGVFFVGDVMLDVFKAQVKKLGKKILKKLKLNPKEYILLTIHRQENTDNPENLMRMLHSLNKCGKKIIFPVHPRTAGILAKYAGDGKNKFNNLFFINPVSYTDMLVLENNANLILTDSGGVQKEAYFLKVPCLTLRKETEWIETLCYGWNKIIGFESRGIKRALEYKKPPFIHKQFFGDGHSAQNIVRILGQHVWRAK